jgi:hypothetical protein
MYPIHSHASTPRWRADHTSPRGTLISKRARVGTLLSEGAAECATANWLERAFHASAPGWRPLIAGAQSGAPFQAKATVAALPSV